MNNPKKLVFTVGNSMMGDDAAGLLLAKKLQREPLADWEVLHGGSAPENYLHRVREMAPQQVLVVDAADMDLSPGEVRLISAEQIGDPFLLTTHSLPLTYLIEAMREYVPKVDLLGIQPDTVFFGLPISARVEDAVDRIYTDLQNNRWNWEQLGEMDPAMSPAISPGDGEIQ